MGFGSVGLTAASTASLRARSALSGVSGAGAID
jgi:hypothetical protein